jgi:hypothetical protein
MSVFEFCLQPPPCSSLSFVARGRAEFCWHRPRRRKAYHPSQLRSNCSKFIVCICGHMAWFPQRGLVTTLEHVLIKVFHRPFPFYHSFPTPRLVVRDVKWGDEEIEGWMTNPFGVPPPRTLATYIMPGRTPHASGHVCNFTTFETFLQLGSIDPACLDVYSSHLHPDLPKWSTYNDFSTTPPPSTAPGKSYMLSATPATPTCLAACLR